MTEVKATWSYKKTLPDRAGVSIPLFEVSIPQGNFPDLQWLSIPHFEISIPRVLKVRFSAKMRTKKGKTRD